MSRLHQPAEPSRALSALAGQVDRLTKRQGGHQEQTDKAITALQLALRDIAESLTAMAKRPTGELGDRRAPTPATVSSEWLTIDDPALAATILVDLDQWLTDVWNHYSAGLPPCWPYHPAAVTELCATHAAWLAATGPEAKPTALADWHERYRKGVSERMATYVRCESATGGHQTGRGTSRHDRWTVTGTDLAEVARWWALTHGTTDDPAPGLEKES